VNFSVTRRAPLTVVTREIAGGVGTDPSALSTVTLPDIWNPPGPPCTVQ
jgi:hypothetical protein